MTASVEYKDGTSPNFDTGVSITLAKEGGFVCHPKDPGGATNMGITIKTARLYRVDENGDGVTDVIDIKTLSRGTAKAIYYHGYWLRVKGDDLPPRLAFYAFDSAVNCGEGNGRRFLQQALGVHGARSAGNTHYEPLGAGHYAASASFSAACSSPLCSISPMMSEPPMNSPLM